MYFLIMPESCKNSSDTLSSSLQSTLDELVRRCCIAEETFKTFSVEISSLASTSSDIVHQHELLFEEATVEYQATVECTPSSSDSLQECVERCCEANELLLSHLQACCTKLDHVKLLSKDVNALKQELQDLISLMRTYVQTNIR